MAKLVQRYNDAQIEQEIGNNREHDLYIVRVPQDQPMPDGVRLGEDSIHAMKMGIIEAIKKTCTVMPFDSALQDIGSDNDEPNNLDLTKDRVDTLNSLLFTYTTLFDRLYLPI